MIDYLSKMIKLLSKGLTMCIRLTVNKEKRILEYLVQVFYLASGNFFIFCCFNLVLMKLKPSQQILIPLLIEFYLLESLNFLIQMPQILHHRITNLEVSVWYFNKLSRRDLKILLAFVKARAQRPCVEI